MVRRGTLLLGTTESCGCLRKDLMREAMRKLGSAGAVHGHARDDNRSPTYTAWCSMKHRCYNSRDASFQYYGGRGITVSERWQNSFSDFLSDVGPRPSPTYSIDRINNDGHYEPGNVRWATPKEQINNRRPPRPQILSERPCKHCGETFIASSMRTIVLVIVDRAQTAFVTVLKRVHVVRQVADAASIAEATLHEWYQMGNR